MGEAKFLAIPVLRYPGEYLDKMVKEFLKDAALYFPSQVAPAFIALITIPIFTRLFPAENYGAYIVISTTVLILGNVSTGWLSMSVVRFCPTYRQDLKPDIFFGTVIRMTVCSGLVMSFILLAVYFLNRNILSSDLSSLIPGGIVLFLAFSHFNVFLQFLRPSRKVMWYTGFSLWRSVMSPVLGLILIGILGLGVEGLLWGGAAATALTIPFILKTSTAQYPHPLPKISPSLNLEMAKYGFPLVLSNVAAWILSLGDRYWLSFFRGNEEVAIYSVSYTISENSIFLINTLIALSSAPILMDIWEREGKKASQLFMTRITRYFVLITVPAVVGLSLLSKSIISLLAAPEYIGGYKIIPFVAAGAFFLGLQHRFQTGPFLYKKTVYITSCTVVSGLINVGLNIWLIPRYGFMAAGVNTLISYILLFVLMTVVSRRMYTWTFPFRSLAKTLGSSAVMGLFLYYLNFRLNLSSAAAVVISLGLGPLVYLIVLFLLREFESAEITFLLSLKSTIFRKFMKRPAI